MSRYVLTIRKPADVLDIMRVVKAAPVGSRVEVKGPQRNVDQNATMWLWLTAWALARPNGRRLTPDQWKAVLLTAWGREVQFLPALDGSGFVPWGQSSSDLSKAEMSDFLDFIIAEATARGIAPPAQQAEAA